MHGDESKPAAGSTEPAEPLHLCVDVYPPHESPYDFLEQAMSLPGADYEEELGKLAMPANKQWEQTTLHVRFMDGDPEIQRRVQSAAAGWSEHCAIQFVFDDAPDAEIRITFALPGSWSYIGTDCLAIAPDKPTMNFGWFTPFTPQEEIDRVVLHEFGHAIGLIHEHQNPKATIPWDKPKVYAYYAGPPNNWSRQKTDVNLFQLYRRWGTRASRFDRESIMLYPIPREHVTDPTYAVGWNRSLSAGDIDAIGRWYPKPASATPQESTPMSETPLSQFQAAPAAAPGTAPASNTANIMPAQGEVGPNKEVSEHGVNIADAGPYTFTLEGSAELAATLVDEDGMTAATAGDDSGANPLTLEANLTPGTYVLRVRAMKKGTPATITVSVRHG